MRRSIAGHSRPARSIGRAGKRFVEGLSPTDAANDQRQRDAKQQHEPAKDKEAFADASAVGDSAHYRRNHNRRESLARLAQTDDSALLMTAGGARLYGQHQRLDHAFKPSAHHLKQQQQCQYTAK